MHNAYYLSVSYSWTITQLNNFPSKVWWASQKKIQNVKMRRCECLFVLSFHQNERTPLHLSALMGRKETCELLVALNAEVDARDVVSWGEYKREMRSKILLRHLHCLFVLFLFCDFEKYWERIHQVFFFPSAVYALPNFYFCWFVASITS